MNSFRMVALFLLCFVAVRAGGADTGTPAVVPEPSTILLLATGLAGIGFAAWRRNRKR